MSVLYLKLGEMSVLRENNTCYFGKKDVKLGDLNGFELTKTLGLIQYINYHKIDLYKQLYTKKN